MDNDILTLIERGISGFSKSQKLIGRYILENYDKAAFMTAGKLGRTIGVSESTVVRFATELGFDGYPEMRRAMERMAKSRLTSVQRIEAAKTTMDWQDILTSVLQGDADNIRSTLEDIDKAEFEKAVDAILAAKRIYILGVRSSAALSVFLGFYFNLLFENVHVATASSVSEIYELLVRSGGDDVVIGLSFPRYSTFTAKAMRFAHDRGAKVIAITDSDSSPMTRDSDINLFAMSEMVSFVDSLVAPLSIVTALIVAVGSKTGNEMRTFENFERMWEEFEVYEKPKG